MSAFRAARDDDETKLFVGPAFHRAARDDDETKLFVGPAFHRAARDDDETKLFVGTASEYAKRLSNRSVADTEDDTAEIVMHPHEIDRARTEIHELLDGFEAAPFTLQRLSELVLEPEQQYTSLDKYLNALTIVLSVSTSSALLGVPRSGAQRTSVSLTAEGRGGCVG